MFETETLLGLAAGLVAGLMHATLLWRSTRKPSPMTPVIAVLRLGIVAAVLVISALAGVIMAAAVGWAIGLALLGTGFVIASGNRSNPKTRSRATARLSR